eukprot:tig00000540_g1920.t1
MLEERCFRAAAAEAKQGSGRDWPAQRVPLSGRVARWLLGSASEFTLAAARAQRARRSRHQRTRSDRKLIFCLLSSPSEGGEVQNDLVRAASLHPLSSGL